jgi:hypothetical protein
MLAGGRARRSLDVTFQRLRMFAAQMSALQRLQPDMCKT